VLACWVGLARFLAQGDCLAAALDCLVRITEQPKGHCPKGQAPHRGVLSIQVGMAPVLFGVVYIMSLAQAKACGYGELSLF
jgi:hypothetical protein